MIIRIPDNYVPVRYGKDYIMSSTAKKNITLKRRVDELNKSRRSVDYITTVSGIRLPIKKATPFSSKAYGEKLQKFRSIPPIDIPIDSETLQYERPDNA